MLFFLAIQYQAREGGLATCRSAKRFCNPQKIHGWIISFLPTRKERMEARLNSVQKCKAILQYLGKSTEGFYLFLAKNY